MGWLKQEDVLPDGRQKIKDILSFISSRNYQYPLESNDDDIAKAVKGMQYAADQMRREWFFSSIGVMDVLDEDGEQTYYLSRASNSHYFAPHNVVPWTNWLGSVYAAVSESLRRGNYPQRLAYGPATLFGQRDVGPLVNYRFTNGILTDADYYAYGTAAAAEPAVPIAPDSDFGLRDIVTTIDTAQDTRLRASMSGTYILTGGPGVGKTTVALHRLSYLINEQNGEGKKTTEHYANRSNLFFTPETMAVIVWKDHLVPYLESCLRDLGLEKVHVQHIDDWVAQMLKPHIPFGLSRGQFQLFTDPTAIAEAKLSCSEEDIEEFLLSAHSLVQDLRERYADLLNEVNQWLDANGLPAIKHIPPERFTADDVESCFQSLLSPIDKALGEWSLSLQSFSFIDDRPRVQRAFDQGAILRQRVFGRLSQEKNRIRSSAARLLMLFYDSPECATALKSASNGFDHAQFLTHVREQRKTARLSRADRFLILWIMHILAQYDSTPDTDKAKALKEYSHVVVDEAQYYHPLVLRLLHALTKEPRKSMTIVGDLEQRISSDGGLATWQAAGIVVPKNNVQRLDTNYRWSKQVFGFLSNFRKAAGLQDLLREPDIWYSGEGLRPNVVGCTTRQEECTALAQRITQLKTNEETQRWSIAVVVPTDEQSEGVRNLIELFRRCDVRARWASGQDLRESRDHVVLTTYDSVVGLEFDAVMLPALDVMLQRGKSQDAIRALWVAVTRAKKYEWLSGLSAAPHWVTLFGRSELEAYRSTAEEFLS